MKQKTIFDAGVNSTTSIYEINDLTGDITSTPRSAYAINETTVLVTTGKIIQAAGHRLNIADGERRPGWSH